MTWQGYDALKSRDLDSLVTVSTLVEELLYHGSMLPPELRVKLDTYHADLANAIEAKGASGKAANAASKPSGTPDPEGGGLHMQPRLWEWTTEGTRTNAAGISGTRAGAMGALEATLLGNSGEARGTVVPVILVDGISGIFYIRSVADCVAVSNGRTVHWE